MRGVARRAYWFGTIVMLALIIVQMATGGAGVFSLAAGDSSGAGFIGLHFIGPLAILLLSLIMVVAGFVGHLPWRMTGLAAAFIPLLFLQALLIAPFADPGSDLPPWLSGLHVLNAVFIFWLAFQWIDWTRRDLARIG